MTLVAAVIARVERFWINATTPRRFHEGSVSKLNAPLVRTRRRTIASSVAVRPSFSPRAICVVTPSSNRTTTTSLLRGTSARTDPSIFEPFRVASSVRLPVSLASSIARFRAEAFDPTNWREPLTTACGV
ncbi:MAG: hypothetical protein DMF59_19210 [Acidobacteria bacterium]|nr:MAG: hypothetical protein DMF59_19210 [Acidobacteriota bacterium]